LGFLLEQHNPLDQLEVVLVAGQVQHVVVVPVFEGQLVPLTQQLLLQVCKTQLQVQQNGDVRLLVHQQVVHEILQVRNVHVLHLQKLLPHFVFEHFFEQTFVHRLFRGGCSGNVIFTGGKVVGFTMVDEENHNVLLLDVDVCDLGSEFFVVQH